jgi:Spy/CpxP family protein refolding chaperone
MGIVSNIALAAAAAGALALGSAALAQDTKKPAAKSEATQEHRGEHRQHGMNGMREMRGGCHGESRGAPAGEHDHS